MGDVGRNPVAEMATSYRQSRHARSHSFRKPFGDRRPHSNLKADKPKLRYRAVQSAWAEEWQQGAGARDIQQARALPFSDQ